MKTSLDLTGYASPEELLQSPPASWKLERPSDYYIVDSYGFPLEAKTLFRSRIRLLKSSAFFLAPKSQAFTLRGDLTFTTDESGDIPKVRTGSLPSLINWLTNPVFTGTEFLDGFLLSYKTFGLSSLQLLKLLIQRFEENDPLMTDAHLPEAIFSVAAKTARYGIGFRVCEVIRYWVRLSPRTFLCPDHNSSGIISELNRFILQLCKTVPLLGQWLRSKIIRYIDPVAIHESKAPSRTYRHLLKSDSYLEPAVAPIAPAHPNILFRYPPSEIARQLTLLEFEQYSHIDGSEFTACGWTKKDKQQRAPNILAEIARSNNLSEWAAAEILKAPSHRERVQTAELFIDIAASLFNLQNLASLIAILGGLETGPIIRLQTLWNPQSAPKSWLSFFDSTVGAEPIITGVHPSKITLLDGLRAATQRSTIKQRYPIIPFPKIPFLGMSLTEMVAIDEGNRTLVKNQDGETVINFRKAIIHGKVTAPLLEAQLHPYLLEPVPELLEYLRSARGFQDHATAAAALSALIEADDGKALPDLPLSRYEDAYRLSELERPNVDEYEIQRLNSAAEMVFSSPETFNRARLWKTWLRKSEQPVWRAIFLKSHALEFTAQAVATSCRLSSVEQSLVAALFTSYLKLETADIQKLLRCLICLGRLPHARDHLHAISLLVTFYKKPATPETIVVINEKEVEQKRLIMETIGQEIFVKQKKMLDIAPLEQLLDFFLQCRTQATELRSELRGQSWTEDDRQQTERLLAAITNARSQAEADVAALSATLQQTQSEVEQREAQLTAVDQEMDDLRRQEEELLRQLLEVRRKIEEKHRQKKETIELRQVSQEKVSGIKTQISASQEFLQKRIDFSAAMNYITMVHLPEALRSSGRLVDIEEQVKTLNEHYIATLNLLLDFELSLGEIALHTLRQAPNPSQSEEETAHRQLLQQTLLAAAQRLSKYLPLAYAQSSANDQEEAPADRNFLRMTMSSVPQDLTDQIPPKVRRLHELRDQILLLKSQEHS